MSNECVDDEPDYMSDDFLAKCIPEDVRPGFKRVSSFVSDYHKDSRNHYIETDLDPRILIIVKNVHFRPTKVNENMICRRKKMNKLNKVGLQKR